MEGIYKNQINNANGANNVITFLHIQRGISMYQWHTQVFNVFGTYKCNL